MKIDSVLILAAGKGTRMGEIGATLPKVLWPLFDKTLLELQIDFIRDYYPEIPIYINSFHFNKEISFFEKSLKDTKNIHFIYEETSLDIGGAIQNFAKIINYKGMTLVLNSDQFLVMTNNFIDKTCEDLKKYNTVLLTRKVKVEDGYNTLNIVNEELASIEQYESGNKGIAETFTGISLINLENLKAKQGKSKFFETIANFDHEKVKCVNCDQFEYLDFGTLDRYMNEIEKIYNNKETEFYKIIKRHATNKKSIGSYMDGSTIIFDNICIDLKKREVTKSD